MVHQKTKNGPILWLAIPLLGIYSKKCKAIYKGNTYTLMFITALSTIPKLRGPTVNEKIKKMWHI
jgi:hypothetical protein